MIFSAHPAPMSAPAPANRIWILVGTEPRIAMLRWLALCAAVAAEPCSGDVCPDEGVSLLQTRLRKGAAAERARTSWLSRSAGLGEGAGAPVLW